MFKLLIFTVAICAANAGVIGIGHLGGYGDYGVGHGAVVAAPVAIAAPIAVAAHHHATSYQNNNQISLHPTAVIAHAAPVAVGHVGLGVGHVSHVGIGIGHAGGFGGYGHGY